MIVVRIHGGLGNQMFQYALGRHLSLTTGQSLRLETGMHNPSHLGKFDLDKFHIVGSIAYGSESSLFWRPAARVLPRLARLFGISREALRIYCQTNSMDVDEEVLRITRSAYLVGAWQNERYFVGSASVIRRDFTLKEPPDAANRARLAEIGGSESVAVHVRRGDYARDAKTAAEYGVCDLSYYQRACARILASVASPRFFVFSDEPAWCRKNLSFIPDLTVVDNNSPERRHEDLRLMAACKHFIIANSSFSWWGAWLGANPNRIVVAPNRWSVSNWFDVRSLLPDAWTAV
jgi:hypothetical protein